MVTHHNQDSSDTKAILLSLRAAIAWQMQMGMESCEGLMPLEAMQQLVPQPAQVQVQTQTQTQTQTPPAPSRQPASSPQAIDNLAKINPPPSAAASLSAHQPLSNDQPLAPNFSATMPSTSATASSANSHSPPPYPTDCDLAGLRAAIKGYDDCLLKSFATNMVFADGNPDAPLMLIGEAPGAEEDRLGKPFVGQSGQLLDKMLASIAVDRDNAYISNVIFWRPPGNRPPTDREIAQCLPFVEKHIALVAPKLLVLVGGIAVKAILQRKEGITRLRGQWHDYRNPAFADNQPSIKVLATYHPAFLMRSPANKREAWLDMLKIKAALADLNG
jgi:DNA polymerase